MDEPPFEPERPFKRPPDPDGAAATPAQVVLEPLVYFKLKARMLELLVQEKDLNAARVAALMDAGVTPGPLEFDDASCTIRTIRRLP